MAGAGGRALGRRAWAGAAVVLAPVAVAVAQDDEVVVEVVEEAPPAGTTALDPDALARPTDGVEDVLATAAGVQIRRLGGLGAFAGVSLRGTGFRQTLVRLDGVPLNPDGVEAVDLAQWPLAGLGSIHLVRGVPPATVGAAPIGGVVDLRTDDTPSWLTAGLAAGSFGTVRADLGGALPWGGPVPGDLLATVDVLGTQGTFSYVDDGGTVYVEDDDTVETRANADRRQGSVMTRVRVGDASARGTWLVRLASREEGLPGPIGLPQRAARLATERALIALQGEGAVGAGHLVGRAWWRGRSERLVDPEGELGGVPEGRRDAYDAVGATLEGAGSLHPIVALRGSADVRREGFVRYADEAVERTQGRWGLGAAVDLPLRVGDVFEAVPGVAARGLVPDDGEIVGAVLPTLVVRGRPDRRVELWASGGGAFRPPDLTELYGDRGALRGNPDLRPERAWKAEVGLRTAIGDDARFDGEIVGYGVWATDAIGWLQNTQRTLVAVNFGSTRTLGGELAVGTSWRDHLGLRVSASLLNAVQTTDDPTRSGRPVPFVASRRLWSRVWGAPGLGFELGMDVDHTGAVPVDPQGVTVQPERTLLGAWVGWTDPQGRWTLSVDLRNLLDARTGPVDRDPLGADDTVVAAPITDFVGYPLPGRTVVVAVRFREVGDPR